MTLLWEKIFIDQIWMKIHSGFSLEFACARCILVAVVVGWQYSDFPKKMTLAANSNWSQNLGVRVEPRILYCCTDYRISNHELCHTMELFKGPLLCHTIRSFQLNNGTPILNIKRRAGGYTFRLIRVSNVNVTNVQWQGKLRIESLSCLLPLQTKFYNILLYICMFGIMRDFFFQYYHISGRLCVPKDLDSKFGIVVISTEWIWVCWPQMLIAKHQLMKKFESMKDGKMKTKHWQRHEVFFNKE